MKGSISMAETKQQTEKRFFLFFFIIILILFAGLGIFNSTEKNNVEKTTDLEVVSVPKPQSLEDIKNSTADQLTVVSGIVYRHLVAYSLVCSEAGMPLQNYPEYFSKKFTREINQIDRAWGRRGKSLETVLTEYDALIYPKISQDIVEELISNERMFVKIVKAKEQGIQADQVIWSEKQEQALNLKDACMLFDETAQKIVEKVGFEKMFNDLMKSIE